VEPLRLVTVLLLAMVVAHLDIQAALNEKGRVRTRGRLNWLATGLSGGV